ncbi:MAG: YhcU family protein [Bacteroidetes bacterium]|nr:YhcU family protein [Bacteroidota bacterium]
MSLEKQIDKLESLIPQASTYKKEISRQTAGWHIHHSLKVIHTILTALERSKPEKYRWIFNMNRAILLSVGWFPRGRAKAPKIARPPDEVDLNGIQEELTAVRSLMDILENQPKDSYFKHPYFGMLNMPDANKFLRLHTHHHLKIIRDIIR